MKIGFVLHQFPELSQTFVLNQIAGLMELGHQVEVLAGRRGLGADLALAHLDPIARKRLLQATTWAGMPASLPKRALRALTHAARELPRRPARIARAFDPRRHGWFGVSGTLYSFAEPLGSRPRHYDALVAHFGPQGVVANGLRELGLLTGPLVTFFHAYDLTSAPRRVGRGMYRHLFEQGELFLPISQRGAGHLKRLGAPPDRIRVHHMGIDLERLEPRPPAQRDRSFRVVSVGRLTEKKGFAVAICAFARILREFPGATYRIVGEGEERKRLERLIARQGVRDRVTLVGRLAPHAVLKEMTDADLCLVPSIQAGDGDEEGIPMVIMEALASRLPVIATHNGAISELLEDGVSGRLIEPGSVDSVCSALCAVARDRALTELWADAGRARVEQEFNLATQLGRLETLLAGLNQQGRVAGQS